MKNDKKQSILEEHDSYDDISAAKKAWITRNAKKEGKDPVMVHAGYKAHFTRRLNASV